MAANKSAIRFLPPALFVAGLLGALAFARSFPAVEGLGTKVRLPVFHGAMTWVNFGLFTLLAVLAITYLITKRDTVFRWEEATRWVAVPLWVLGSVLGLKAAMSTWDFTGSKSSPISVAMQDPRLVAQFWVLLLGLGLIALGLIVENRRWLAAADIGFVAAAGIVLGQAILGPGKALHPDSPVMNSDEIAIKLIFFGIAGCQMLAALAAVWWVVRARRNAAAPSDEIAAAPAE